MRTNKKQMFLTILVGLLAMFELHAQVRIGGEVSPAPGAILDLNSAYKGGLLLPNTSITDLNKIPADFTNASVKEKPAVLELSGTIVYNTHVNVAKNIQKGFYLWDGYSWKLLAIDGGMMTIPPDTKGYDPVQPIDAERELESLTIPVSDPGLSVSGSYVFSVIAGSEYALVEPNTSIEPEFGIRFMPNNTAFIRKAVVMVTNPAGKTSTFVFTQQGSACNEAISPTIATLGSTTSFCANGAVHAYVNAVAGGTGNRDDYNYFWTQNNVPLAEGMGVELKEAGTYFVYADKIGCGVPDTLRLTGPTSNTAPQPLYIIADNDGIICGTNSVQLSVLNAPVSGTVHWFKDNVLMPACTGSSILAIGENNHGQWYAVLDDGGCASTCSNKLLLVYQPSTAVLAPVEAYINETSISEPGIKICSEGTLKLEIKNPQDYPNATYDWFANGQSLGSTTQSLMYVVPPSVEKLVFSLSVKVPGTCPVSVTSTEFTVTRYATPPSTSINDGAGNAYICGSVSALLQASNSGGDEYEWLCNGVLQSETSSTYRVNTPGNYSVRYSVNGCWSLVSQKISVLQSSQVTAIWSVCPGAEEIIGSDKAYSVVAAPDVDMFTWEPVNPQYAQVANITKLGNGNLVTVHYNGPATADYKMKVVATNECGSAVLLSGAIDVKEDCVPAGSMVINPMVDTQIKQGASINFSANANTGSDAGSYSMTYAWYVDGVLQSLAGNSKNFTFRSASLAVDTDYEIYATATNSCTGSPVSTPKVMVRVNIDPTSLPDVETYEVVFSGGKTCLDIHQTEDQKTNSWAGHLLPLSVRPNDFGSGSNLSFNYPFGGKNISNIRFFYDDPSGIVQSVTGNAMATNATACLTFRNSFYTNASGKKYTITLYAVYAGDGQNYVRPQVITVQDGACGCPARVSANTYRMFTCHNAGANTAVNPFENGVNLRGNYYFWGRKEYSVDRDLIVANVPDWNNTPPGTWSAYRDPCPVGWRVSPLDVMQAVVDNRTEFTLANGFLKLGAYFWLPAQGYYYRTSGSNSTRYYTSPSDMTSIHHYDYWTATESSATYGNNFWGYKNVTHKWGSFSKINYNEPVRCVQEGNAYSNND